MGMGLVGQGTTPPFFFFFFFFFFFKGGGGVIMSKNAQECTRMFRSSFNMSA